MDDKARAHVIITGRVQRVFFRMSTRNEADRIGGITGWVRNLTDGSVEAVFEGEKPVVTRMVEWCHSGPPHAGVQQVNLVWEDYTGEFDSFDVRF